MPPDTDRAYPRSPIPRSVRQMPADLAAVVLVVIVTGFAILTPGVAETPLRIIVGLPFVLFVPGYAFIAALFPEAGATDDSDVNDDEDVSDPAREDDRAPDVDQRLTLTQVQGRGSIDGIERVALSFGTSIAIVPLLGLVLNFTPWGIRLLPVYLAVGGFTVIAAVSAAYRRSALPAEARFRVPYEQWMATARTELFEPESRMDLALNSLLAISVLLATASVTYAVVVPTQGESFTEFYVLTENETGELVADDYPTDFTTDETAPVHVGIGNQEHQDMEYSVVIALQEVQTTNNTTQVLDERELTRFQTAVPANETQHRQVNLTPTMAGERLRLAFLLYQGAPPADPSVETAYRDLHLWVNVTATPEEQVRVAPATPSSVEIHQAGPRQTPQRGNPLAGTAWPHDAHLAP